MRIKMFMDGWVMNAPAMSQTLGKKVTCLDYENWIFKIHKGDTYDADKLRGVGVKFYVLPSRWSSVWSRIKEFFDW